MSPEQTRAARGWLGWSQVELARLAKLSVGTVRSFEGGHRAPLTPHLLAMRQVIEAAGLRLLFDRYGKAAGIARQDAGNDLFGDGSPA
jgi:DNA-binding transcriptional regulator YiaG